MNSVTYDKIFKEEFEKNLRDLIRIPSSDGDEINISEYIFSFGKKFESTHEIFIQEYSENGRNVIFKSKNQRVIVDVHLDTVSISDVDDWKQSPYDLLVDNNDYIGLGAVDVKCNIACVLAIFSLGLGNEMTAVFCGSEETTAEGVKYMLKTNILQKSPVIVMEPTNNIPCSGHKGSAGIIVNLKGVSAHASIPETGINAIERGILFVENFKQMFTNFKKYHEVYGSTTYSIGTIKGGSSMNIVPDGCEIGIDIRITPGQTEGDLHTFTQKLKEFLNNDETLQSYYFPAAESKSKHTDNVCPFWTHAGYYSQYGFDAKIYGPGDIKHAHIPNESVNFESVHSAFNYLLSQARNNLS